jgi:single-stranded DNA-binding protein
MNVVHLAGRIYKNSFHRGTFRSGIPKLRFKMAVRQPFKRKGRYHYDAFWIHAAGEDVNTLCEYARDRMVLAVHGHLFLYRFTNKDGERRVETMIKLDGFEFLPLEAPPEKREGEMVDETNFFGEPQEEGPQDVVGEGVDNP